MRRRHIVICGLPDYTILFLHYLINGVFFRKKRFIEHKMCVRVSLQLFSETFFILGRTERDMIKNVYWSSHEVPFIVSDCN
jgi:hypothetical protein